MSEQKKTVKKKPAAAPAKKHKTKKNDKSTMILIVGLVLIAIPCAILGWILISASMDTGKPINGDRFKGDLDPAITKDQLSEIESRIKGENQVEKVTVELTTATLRVYVDTVDSISDEEASALSETAYNDVTAVLNEGTYFTASNGKKMYDLEVHVYNNVDKSGSEDYVYVIRAKNSSMEQAATQIVSKPLDADLAQQLREELAATLHELRQHKGMTPDEALRLMDDVLYFGVMMVYMDDADGMVSGACHSTADTLRPALQILKTAPGTELVSSFFVEDVPDCPYGDDGLFVFADCALNIYPTAEELAEIAIASANSFEQLCGGEPRVAMLSYSSYGSGKGESVEKMAEATRIAKERAPQLQLDGELQVDAAIVDTVAALKAPDSPVAGKANVLIFPNIDAGNIAYKLVQRLAKADAFGPILQGVAKPVNDLSRGCSADDIVGTVAVTCVQSQARKAQS